MALAELHRHRNPKASAQLSIAAASGAQSLAIISEQTAGILRETPARVRRRETTCCPLREADAEPVLQPREAARYRWRRTSEPPCRFRQAARIHDGDKHGKLVQSIHDPSVKRKNNFHYPSILAERRKCYNRLKGTSNGAPMPNASITLYGLPISGHCHRVELMLRMLGLEFGYEVISRADFVSPNFLALNPLGQIPVLKDNELVLPDSNAILVYLATKYDAARVWLPADPVIAAHVQRWLSIAAGEIRFGPAMARAIRLLVRPGDIEAAQKLAERVLTFMEGHLAQRNFLAHEAVTIADLACYSYVAVAPEGGIPLAPYPNIRAWLERVEALPGFTPMPRSPQAA
jgi:glutathione S-transferase